MKVIPIESANCFKIPGITSCETVGSETGARFLTVTVVNVESGVSMKPHKHDSSEQIYFIIDGEGETTIDDHTMKVKKDDTILIFPNEVHSIKNSSQKVLRYISATSPPIEVRPIYDEWSKK